MYATTCWEMLLKALGDPLKGKCHETKNGYNWYKKTDQKNLVMPEHIFNSFQSLLCFNSKKTCFNSFSYDGNSANDK
jgi:hypothetical protein